MSFLVPAMLAACLIVFGLAARDRRADRRAFAAIVALIPDHRESCETWSDHNPIPLGRRSWRHGWRKRVVLHCIRCNTVIGDYPNLDEALAAKEWGRNQRWRRRGLL